MTHRMDAELSIGDRLEPPISRMVFDPLPVAAEPITRVQHRRVPVSERRTFVEFTGCEPTETVEVRQQMRKQIVRQVDRQQIPQGRIIPVEIHTASIRRDRRRFDIAQFAVGHRYSPSICRMCVESLVAQRLQYFVGLFFAAHLQDEVDDCSAYGRTAERTLLRNVYDVAIEFAQQIRQAAKRAWHVVDLDAQPDEAMTANETALQQ